MADLPPWGQQGAAAVVDVSDRAARLAGHVTVDGLPAADISDRVARLLGHVAVDGIAQVDVVDEAGRLLGVADVSDRAARLLGHVTVDGLPAADISDRVARVLGVADVSDRAARLLGQVVELGGIGDTVRAAGAVAGPAAAAAIATIAAPGAGVYAVEVVTFFGGAGTPTVAETSNMELRHGATTAGRLLTTSGTPIRLENRRLTIAAGEAISVNAVAVATAGVNYFAAISATRVA